MLFIKISVKCVAIKFQIRLLVMIFEYPFHVLDGFVSEGQDYWILDIGCHFTEFVSFATSCATIINCSISLLICIIIWNIVFPIMFLKIRCRTSVSNVLPIFDTSNLTSLLFGYWYFGFVIKYTISVDSINFTYNMSIFIVTTILGY